MAVLGLLAVAPMSAYALAEQTTRALGFMWTSSRRLLLSEPRRLAQEGLVEAIEASQGSRAAQLWQTTAAGRDTLRRWLKQPIAPTQVHSEFMLRLIFADHGDLEDLRAQVQVRREQLRESARIGVAIVDELLGSGGLFPDRLHITTAMSQFHVESGMAEYAFLEWLEDEIGQWPDTRTPDPTRHQAALFALRTRLNSILDRP